jgi:DNA-binding GntR family transcriptional regulator
MNELTIASATTSPSRLQSELAARILHMLKQEGAAPGRRLVEAELCQQFGVSRTPVRGALKQLESQGIVEGRTNRGYVLATPIKEAPPAEPLNPQLEEERQLIAQIAEARNNGELLTDVAQQEICRRFGVSVGMAVRVLRQLSDMGLVERKAGNGWTFLPSIDSPRAQSESYAFRRLIEPACLLQPGFEADPLLLKDMRERHIAFSRMPWRDTLAVDFYDMNSQFHEQLARFSGNRYLYGAVKQQSQLRTFLNYHWNYGVERVRESIDEHVAIIDALMSGDRAKASQLMFDHLVSSED